MTKVERHRIKLQEQVLGLVGGRTLRLSEIAGRFGVKDRARVAQRIVPYLVSEGYLEATYDGSNETCFRLVVR